MTQNKPDNLSRSRQSARKALLTLSGVALLGVLASGPLQADSSQEFYEDAHRLMFSEDHRGALIQLKNALQQDPEHVPSLLLMGQLQLRLKDPAAAENILLKARVLGADRVVINLSLADAYLQQAKYHAVINDLSDRGLPRDKQAELLGFMAQARLGLGELPKAAALIEEALALDPNALRPGLAKVTLHLASGKLNEAEDQADRVVRLHGTSAEALNQYASVAHAKGQLATAIRRYDQALVRDPEHLDARLAKVSVMVDLKQYEEALPDLDYLNEHYPFDPRSAYFRALTYDHFAQTGRPLPEADKENSDDKFTDTTSTKDWRTRSEEELVKCTQVIAQLPIKRVTRDQKLTMVASLAHYSLGEFEKSRAYLEEYRKYAPYHLGANRLLGDVLLKLGAPEKAIQTLRPLLERHPNDQHLNQLVINAYTETGRHAQATTLLERLRSRSGENPVLDTQLALSRLRSGRTNQGISDLSRLLKTDPTNVRAGYSLAIAQLQNQQLDEALATSEKLLQQHPNNASYLNLKAIALQGLGQLDKSAATFEQVLTNNPDLTGAAINLAKIDISRQRFDAARERLTAIMEAQPEEAKSRLALARLEDQLGNQEQALRLAEAAHQLLKSDVEIRFFLTQLYLDNKDYTNAENLAQDTADKFVRNLDAQILLPQTLVRVGKERLALTIYKRLVKEAGFNAETLYRLSTLLNDIEAHASARHALFKALEGNPSHLPSHKGYIKIQLTLREYEDALKRSLELIKSHPQYPVGYGLAGDALMRLKRPVEAESLYRQGLKIGFESGLSVGLFQSLMAQGKRSQAERSLQQHWRQHPADSAVGLTYAELQMSKQRWKQAMTSLRSLLDKHPDNANLLNNLAYTSSQLGDPKALDYARAALERAPGNPMINDTLGWILVQQGESAEGLKYLREAAARRSGHPEIHYHLATALHNLGRHQEARNELRIALNSPSLFNGRGQAEALHKQLQEQIDSENQ